MFSLNNLVLSILLHRPYRCNIHNFCYIDIHHVLNKSFHNYHLYDVSFYHPKLFVPNFLLYRLEQKYLKMMELQDLKLLQLLN
mmetsp:Transcript_106804/g.259419  ORF Transcript_106804/g.259419 Transcript_106804/m.259419 type:complete len:83 (-) Transcript_106804:76-324(-)